MGKKKRQEKRKEYLILIPLLLVFGLLVFFNINVYRQREVAREHLLRAKEDLRKISGEEDFPILEITEEEIEKEIERIAREQLLLRKEGEEVIVISREEGEEEKEKEKEKEESFFERIIGIFKTE